jgi:hypothetical protein
MNEGLHQHGFKSVGMVDDHLVSCFRHREVAARLAKR